MSLNYFRKIAATASCSLFLLSNSFASGLQIWEQSAAGLGDYHAGGAAEASDASTQWYNPAGLVNLKQPEVSFGGVLVRSDVPFNGTVNVDKIFNSSGGTYTPEVSAQGGTLTPIPNFHFAYPVNDRFALGFGIVAPFGMVTDYGASNFLQYVTTKTQIQVVDLTPGFGVKITPLLSVGAGIDIAYVTGEFNQNAAVGMINGFWKQASSVNKGHDWTYGFHLGLLFNFTENMRLGLTYHSQMIANLHGKSTFEGSLATPSIGTANYNFKTSFRLPAWTELSFYNRFNKAWAMMASAIYTQWDTFKELKLENVVDQSSGNDTITILQNYKNTWNFALGVHYNPIESLTLKLGTGYDFSPTNNTDRNIYGPDQNRFVLAIGAAYNITEDLKVDISYNHYFVKDASINTVQTVNAGNTIETVNGTVKSNADLFGLQLTWKF